MKTRSGLSTVKRAVLVLMLELELELGPKMERLVHMFRVTNPVWMIPAPRKRRQASSIANLPTM